MAAQKFAEDRYEKMAYRRCGRRGLKLPVVSLGLWQSLGESGNQQVCRKCCYYAFDHGITHVDLANNYGLPPGNSETVFGKIVKDMPRDELIISTKAGFYMWPGPYGDWGSKKNLVASLDQSLRRMGLDYVDIFYHHRPDPETPIEETMAALDLIVRQGKALYAGVSNYPGARFADAVNVIRQHDWAPLLIHQAAYNMFQRRVETDLLPHTDRESVGVIAFCPLDQGKLTDRYLDGLPADSRMARNPNRGRLVRKTEGRRRVGQGGASERSGESARPDDGPACSDVDLARPARHERADWRVEGGAVGRQHRGRPGSAADG